MTVKLQKRLINVAEYHLMAKVGILEEKGLELIEGEIIKKHRTSSRHAGCNTYLNHILNDSRLQQQLQEEVILSIKNPVILDEFSELEPDVALLKYRSDYYGKAHPTPQDVLLVIEVADSTLDIDRKIKAPLYAKAGIPEYWIVNIEAQQIEVYDAPQSGSYQQKNVFGINDEVKAQFNVQIGLKVKEVFG
ncbi:MAG TPA: hypothetical protein DCS93_39430 [Microscillaceae bacterium]|nr:hypothetical protein [Microscillaceae bacterium]